MTNQLYDDKASRVMCNLIESVQGKTLNLASYTLDAFVSRAKLRKDGVMMSFRELQQLVWARGMVLVGWRKVTDSAKRAWRPPWGKVRVNNIKSETPGQYEEFSDAFHPTEQLRWTTDDLLVVVDKGDCSDHWYGQRRRGKERPGCSRTWRGS